MDHGPADQPEILKLIPIDHRDDLMNFIMMSTRPVGGPANLLDAISTSIALKSSLNGRMT